MANLQTAYADEMNEFGLQRGDTFSISKHRDMRRFYGMLEDTLRQELPPPLHDENIYDYSQRVSEVYKTACAHHMQDLLEALRQYEHQMADYRSSHFSLKDRYHI